MISAQNSALLLSKGATCSVEEKPEILSTNTGSLGSPELGEEGERALVMTETNLRRGERMVGPQVCEHLSL